MYSCLSLYAVLLRNWQLVHYLIGWAITPESLSAAEAPIKIIIIIKWSRTNLSWANLAAKKTPIMFVYLFFYKTRGCCF